jgi:hypothetical protein
MTTNNPWLADNIRLCPDSRMYLQLLQNSIFANLSIHTTATQFIAAQESMHALCEQRAATLDPLHYGALTGTHSCIRDIFELASAYLTNLRLTQPAPEPPAAPAPPEPPAQQPLSDEALMATLQNYVAETTKQTFFGQDQETEEEENQSA